MKSTHRFASPGSRTAAIATTSGVATYFQDATNPFDKVEITSDTDCSLSLTFANANASPVALPAFAAPGGKSAAVMYPLQMLAGVRYAVEWSLGPWTTLNVLQSSGSTVNLLVAYGKSCGRPGDD